MQPNQNPRYPQKQPPSNSTRPLALCNLKRKKYKRFTQCTTIQAEVFRQREHFNVNFEISVNHTITYWVPETILKDEVKLVDHLFSSINNFTNYTSKIISMSCKKSEVLYYGIQQLLPPQRMAS
jgi:hypothetical protein